MIAPLRRRHRWMIGVLALALPALVILALGERPDWPDSGWGAVGSVPGSPAAVAQPEGPLVAKLMAAGEADPSDGGDLTVRRHPTELWLKLGSPLRAPDVLAYWWVVDSPESSGIPEGVEEAFLLGPVSAQHANLYRLPAGSETAAGRLLLYSLGHQSLLLATDILAGADPVPSSDDDPVPSPNGDPASSPEGDPGAVGSTADSTVDSTEGAES